MPSLYGLLFSTCAWRWMIRQKIKPQCGFTLSWNGKARAVWERLPHTLPCCALLLSLSSWALPWCHLCQTQADTAWHILPLSPGAEAHQPGLHCFHPCCFSSGQSRGFSCQICLTCHRLSFPISILICTHVLTTLENAEQQISALHSKQDPVAASAKLSKSSLVPQCM